jgi:predicted nucleic acid-binding protein
VTVILDASALVAYLLEEGSEGLTDNLSVGVESVELILAESYNAILTAIRDKRIIPANARSLTKVLSLLAEANIRIHPQKDLLDRAFELGNAFGLTVYDGLYLALAEKLKGSIITLDGKQANIAKQLGIEVIEP